MDMCRRALGTLWLVVSPATTFRVTQKVPPSEAENDLIEELELGVEPSGGWTSRDRPKEPSEKLPALPIRWFWL